MPVRQATPTAMRGSEVGRAVVEEPDKPTERGSRGKRKSPLAAPGRPLRKEPGFQTLVQALLDLSEPEPPLPSDLGPTGALLPPIGSPPETAPLSPRHAAISPVSAASAATALPPTPAEDVQAAELSSISSAAGADLAAVASDFVSASGAAPQGGPAIRANGKGARAEASGDIDYHHDSEAEFGRLLDYYGIEWQYEPHQFPLEWREGRPIVMFTPDFYLLEYDLYIELTTMRQALVRRKNRKLRLLRALYPEISIKLLYRRDYRRLLQRFSIAPEELDAEAAQHGEVVAYVGYQNERDGGSA